MVEALCLRCGKRLLISPDATQCFLCGGELKFRHIPQTEKPMQEVITRLTGRIVEIADSNPQAKKDLKEWLEAAG